MFCFCGGSRDGAARRQRAIARVKAKFPNLQEDTSGWWRALNNQLRKPGI